MFYEIDIIFGLQLHNPCVVSSLEPVGDHEPRILKLTATRGSCKNDPPRSAKSVAHVCVHGWFTGVVGQVSYLRTQLL